MTYQFIIEYVENDLPYDFGYEDADYESLKTKSRRVRARTTEQAIEKFTREFPSCTIVGWM